jgi:hypothetical protein
MSGRALVICLITSALIAGCGGDDANNQASGTTTTTTQPAGNDLASRALKSGELKGFEPTGPGDTANSPRDWLSLTSDTTIDPDTYAKRGFVAGYLVDLQSSDGTAGQSMVVQFKTPAQAQAEVTRYSKPVPGTDTTPFPVAGIPTAKGFTAKGQTVGDHVDFTKGSYFYGVGRVRKPASAKESRDSVIAAAKRQYARVPD